MAVLFCNMQPSIKMCLFLVISFLPACVCGQNDSTKSSKRLRITPLPVIYYSPETRLGFGALVAANFETITIPDSITRSSYAQTYFLYTVNKQYDWGASTRIYSPQNNFIFFGKLNYTFFPEYYYGIETEDPESKKDTIEYNQIAIDLRFYWKIRQNFYAGFASRFNRIDNVDGGTGHFYEDKPPGYEGYWLLGFAPALTLETRDNYVYPRRGHYLELLYYLHPSWDGQSFGYGSLRIDARKYFPVTWLSEIDAVAFQFIGNMNTGDVPFKDMADIGGSNTMRGYYKGFYRYNNLYALQVEYRAHVWWRLGFTVWAGGALTPLKWYTFFDNPIKPNLGLGLRIMLNRNDLLNVRVDQGFGNKKQSGFYLDIAEAY